jgi:hypothetical protein
MIEVSSENRGWLSKFFSGRNAIRWKDLEADIAPEEFREEIESWLSILETGRANVPICLPCLSDAGTIEWYAGARTIQGAYALADELQAFIGRSFSDFDGRPHSLDRSDPVESALKGIFVEPLYKLEAKTPKEISNLRRAFSLFQALVNRRPNTFRRATQPFGIVRGQFDRALLAGNETEARHLLEEMRRAGRLTSENLKFLEVRLLAGLGLWHQIVQASNLLRELTDFPLPPRVVRDISEAFFRVYVEPYEQSGGLEESLEALRASSLTRLAPLFSRRHGIQHPTVIKIFLVRELLRTPPDFTYASDLLSRLGVNDRSPLVSEISAYLGSLQQTAISTAPKPIEAEIVKEDPWFKADAAFDENEFDRALVFYLGAPISPKAIARMATCAKFSGDTDSARSVLKRFDSISLDVADKLSESVLRTLEDLKEQAHAIPIHGQDGTETEESAFVDKTGWLEWARWVAGGASAKESENTLEQYAETWPIDDLCGNEQKAVEFATLVGNAGGEVEAVFRNAFDRLFNAFVIDVERPKKSLKSLYKTLLFLLVTSDSLSKSDLNICTQIIFHILNIGLSEEEYNDLADQLIDLLENHGALSSLDWAIDVAEILSIERCQNDEARLRFVTNLVNLAQRVAHRLAMSQRRSLELLFLDYSMPLPDAIQFEPNIDQEQEEQEEQEVAQRLSGKKIGIYTLTKPAGKRAAKMLKEMAPDCQISLNNDHVCTERLSALAKTSDIFVFAWKSSKHQAFYCVKDHRPPELPILQPLGKGSASIIREVLEFV